ncbi:hypothetical protein JG687_00001746 [Phytophthora cactorum]|uniref:Deubiquitinating enzyme MINDY-3/4 conserved domain-containing protein n=1 Tax=Phytophthora cactorum TaxID=29920 RepID=A0A8T1V0A5_9STRA|nr:hypothetical protein JG687_00001746 [Phytophthora cactorum]
MSTRLLATEVEELLRLLWPAVSIGDGASDDSQRWYQQGFELQSLRDFPLGLVQGHGGPCGVLAAVQAEMLRLFLFVRHRYTLSNNDFNLQQLMEHERLAEDEAARRQLLAEAMASLLVQCVGDDRAVHVVVQEDADKGAAATYRECTISVPFMPTENSPPDLVELLYHEMPAFCSPHGVINFTFSVLRTKGVAAVREEMDDPANTLTGAFGHCTQELVNLLLTGNAVSNVFDGSVPMGDTGLFLHGVPQRARIGYLTQLEALRYCQVGSYYKSPQFPVWVLGSSSHFSVGFALDARVCEESASAQLFQRVQRVFKTFDPMETGFMEMASLAESLKQLGVAPEILSNEYWMARLLARLEISSGAGIVLWDEYWTVISVLLHTNDFELALSGEYDANATTESRSPLQRSDSDLARELQAQFDAEERGQIDDTAVDVGTPGGLTDLVLGTDDVTVLENADLGESHQSGRVPMIVVFVLSAVWTFTLAYIQVHATEMANSVMNTTHFDNGEFWLAPYEDDERVVYYDLETDSHSRDLMLSPDAVSAPAQPRVATTTATKAAGEGGGSQVFPRQQQPLFNLDDSGDEAEGVEENPFATLLQQQQQTQQTATLAAEADEAACVGTTSEYHGNSLVSVAATTKEETGRGAIGRGGTRIGNTNGGNRRSILKHSHQRSVMATRVGTGAKAKKLGFEAAGSRPDRWSTGKPSSADTKNRRKSLGAIQKRRSQLEASAAKR